MTKIFTTNNGALKRMLAGRGVTFIEERTHTLVHEGFALRIPDLVGEFMPEAADDYGIRDYGIDDFLKDTTIPDLERIEVTNNKGGYPEHVFPALIGFGTYEAAEDVAEKYGFNLCGFKRRNGQDLWMPMGWMHGPFVRSEDDYGNDYSEAGTAEAFFDDRKELLSDMLRDIRNVAELEDFVKETRRILEEIDKAGDDSIVMLHQGRYFETVKRIVTRYHDEDVTEYAIGIC